MSYFVKNKKNQRGVVLLLSLLILSSILVVTLGAAELVMAGMKMNRIAGYSDVAFFAAEAGLERALWEARKNDNAASIPETNLAGGGSYVVNYTIVGATSIFKSIGQYQGVKRSVEGAY